jgi:hypothetical protein
LQTLGWRRDRSPNDRDFDYFGQLSGKLRTSKPVAISRGAIRSDTERFAILVDEKGNKIKVLDTPSGPTNVSKDF